MMLSMQTKEEEKMLRFQDEEKKNIKIVKFI